MALHPGEARVRRFFVDEGVAGSDVEITGPLAHRLTKVLRLKAGERLALFDGSGTDVVVEIADVDKEAVRAHVVERRAGPPESPTRVHLYQSITKGERFEWLIEKATEVGVASVSPLLTARAVVKTEGGGNRADRWRRIAIEAAEQCGRSVVPEIGAPISFGEALKSAEGVVLLPYESADHLAPSISAALQARIDELFAQSAVSIVIGPEGGFEDSEVEAAREAGATVVTLGQRVLRSETAGIVAATLVMQAIGQLG